MCDMVRNGLTWNVVWFGIMSEMVFDVEWCNVKCGGMMWWGAMCYTFHISPPQLNNFHIKPHFRHSTPYISHHTTFSVKCHQITRRDVEIAWCGIWCDVECFAVPDVGCCALFILMWLWCGKRCDVEYVQYGAMLNVMSCNVRWGMKCGDAMWNDGVVHGEYGGVLWCKMWLWNTERCGMVWRHIRHGVMWNDGWNAVWDVCCGLECAVG